MNILHHVPEKTQTGVGTATSFPFRDDFLPWRSVVEWRAFLETVGKSVQIIMMLRYSP